MEKLNSTLNLLKSLDDMSVTNSFRNVYGILQMAANVREPILGMSNLYSKNKKSSVPALRKGHINISDIFLKMSYGMQR